MTTPRILLFDIETAPNLAWVWGKWEQNVIDFERNWYMLSWSAKWLGEKDTLAFGLPDFPLYQRDKRNDKQLVSALWKLIDEADVVVAHNGDDFDIKKTNVRFIENGLPPPSPYRTIDTKKVAKRYFKFDSNKLDDLGSYLGLGNKIDTGGFELWQGCMEGDMKAWKKMVAYNKQDVILLEKVYLKLRTWMQNHPNLNVINETTGHCPLCSSSNVQRRGFSYTQTGKRQRFQCLDCYGWFAEKIKLINS
jgi:DNA polymerase elongation subunit (family B)